MIEPVEIVEVAPTWLAVVRERLPHSELARFVPAACGEVWKFVKQAEIAGPGRHVAVYLDEDGLTEVGVEVASEFDGDGRVVCSRLPAGRALHVTHFGPYPGLKDAYAAVGQWCNANNRKIGLGSWEIYGHWEPGWNSAPEKIRTDVFCLLNDD